MKAFFVCWRDKRGFLAKDLVAEVSADAAATLIRATYVGPDPEDTLECVEWCKELDISKPGIFHVINH